MTNECDCGYYNKICIFCGILSKHERLCEKGHININLNKVLRYHKNYYTNIKEIIFTFTGINHQNYNYNKIINLLSDEYKKCNNTLQYVALDYNHTNPFTEGTAANTILGEDEPRQLIYPFHNIIKDVNSTDIEINEKHHNKNVELFVKSFKILDCVNDIAYSRINYKHLIDKLVIKPDGTKYSYNIDEKDIKITIDWKLKKCIDNSLNNFIIKLKLDIKEKNCDWLIYRIQLKDPNRESGHANILIVNMLNPNDIKMFYFEPHGFSEENLGYKVCYPTILKSVTEYNSIPNNTRTITLGPETFNNKRWQTNEPFCASWCMFFMSIVLLNPNLSMVNIYELFKIDQPEIRYLLLYRFLFWYCNFNDTTQETSLSKSIFSKASEFLLNTEFIYNSPKIVSFSMSEINNPKTYYYCKKFTIKSETYPLNLKTSILKNVYEYEKNLSSLIFDDCVFGRDDISVLSKLSNLKKLTMTNCRSIPDLDKMFEPTVIPTITPVSLVKLTLQNNTFNEMIIIKNLSYTIEYINIIWQGATFMSSLNFLYIIRKFKNIIVNTNFPVDSFLKSEKDLFDSLQSVNKNTIINDRNNSFYRYKDEQPNICPKCEGNDDEDFNNEIEEMSCVLCGDNLVNEFSKIKF